MEEFRIVKEIVTVTRFYLVKGDKKSAIKDVKNCDRNTIYLHSCDVIWWDDEILYEIEELGEAWKADLRLETEARHINEHLSQEIPESDLTKRKRKRIIEKEKLPPKFSVLSMIGMK